MNSSRMSSNREKGHSKEEEESAGSPIFPDKEISEGNHNQVEDLICGNLSIVAEDWPKSIEKCHESPEEPFEKDISACCRFSSCWQVRILSLFTQVVVMISMVLSERKSRWHSLGNVT